MIDEIRLAESSLWYTEQSEKEGVYCKGWNDCNRDWIDEIKKMPKLGEWIPCSERLPEERGNYLATIKVEAGTFVIYVWFGEEGWIDGYSEPINVIAWMPLPQPYMEGDKEDEPTNFNTWRLP